MHDGQPHLSLRRVLLVILPIAIVGLGAYLWSATLEPAARNELSQNVFARILSANTSAGPASMKYPDEDKDLVADSPEDPAKCIDPQELVFSFVAGETESVPPEALNELTAALKEKTGREVKYIHYGSVEEQLNALKKGELHIAGLNTGIVPAAVQQAGFVPICTFGREDGTYGYIMQLIVPADSPIKEPKDLKGRKVMFTRPDSNSGCKALVMYLRDEQDLQPERDYAWGFSTGHEESIKGVAKKEYEAAPVASDMLARMIEGGEIEADSIRTVYESERFPPATIGYVYNLTPELRTAIRDALVGFNIVGTGLEGEFGADATKLVPVDYKNDWANARKIDQLIAEVRRQR
jgi:phosphonate transport system substrate-binding protein